MTAKLCHRCGAVVPIKEWARHSQRHRDSRKERKGGGRPWRRIVEQVKRRDRHACVVCGSKEDLEVHHIDGNWRNNALSNLQTVCFTHNPRGRKAS